MVKIARLSDAILEVFLTTSKPSRRSINTAKRKGKERKKRKDEKKIPKIENPKDVGHFLIQKLPTILTKVPVCTITTWMQLQVTD